MVNFDLLRMFKEEVSNLEEPMGNYGSQIVRGGTMARYSDE